MGSPHANQLEQAMIETLQLQKVTTARCVGSHKPQRRRSFHVWTVHSFSGAAIANLSALRLQHCIMHHTIHHVFIYLQS